MTDGPLLSAADLGLAVSGEKPQSLAFVRLGLVPSAKCSIGSRPGRLNLSKAAKLLGISRPTLYDLMQQHQIGLDL
jgi:two-component system NtrC family response regulator